jgi:UDP-N-acetylmuramate--alanine ligase
MRVLGHDVFGSDRSDSALIKDLESQGIKIVLTQDGSGMPENLDLFVYSEAIPESAPERVEATRRKLRQISYFKAVGELTEGKDLICICGTHGKSSTTAMVARAFVELKQNPSVVVGTKMTELGGRNWRAGSDLWIVEACEYRRSFHYLSPKTILLTNADGDHFDAFKDIADYEQAFVDFIKKLPVDGVVIGHGADKQVKEIVKRAGRTFIDADTEELIAMQTPGEHMRKNAQLVLALCRLRGLSVDSARDSLAGFAGTWRRMQLKGINKKGVTVIDDYGHHPIEIRATLAAMREKYPEQRIVCVFQPHTHDRTLKFWNEFTASFADADLVIIPNIYDARPDRDAESANLPEFMQAIAKGSRTECIDGKSLTETEVMLKTGILEKGDVLIVMGAGDVTKLAEMMLRD